MGSLCSVKLLFFHYFLINNKNKNKHENESYDPSGNNKQRNQDFNFVAGIIEKYYTSYKNWKEKIVKVKEAMQKINLITFFFWD